MRTCTNCGDEKPLNDFFRHKASRGGYLSRCKTCVKADNQAYYRKNRSRIIDQQRAYVRANAELTQERHRSAHQRRRQDPEWVEKQREYNRNYGRANPKKRLEAQRRRLQRIANAPVSDFTKKQWESLKRVYRNRCAYCSRELGKLHTDHVIPLFHRGEHSARNIVPSCGPCNMKKRTRTDMPFQVIPAINRDLHPLLLRSP